MAEELVCKAGNNAHARTGAEMTLPSNILLGVGCDRNGDLINPVEYADLLSKNGLNATSIGFFGRDTADFTKVAAQAGWLSRWLSAMRAKGITTYITLTGTGGVMGNAQWDDAWFGSMLDVLLSLGKELVIVTPVAEANIKEGADAAVQAKFRRWHELTQTRLAGWKLGWNFQCRPNPGEVWPGWIGVCHPQNWTDGFAGQILATDCKSNPPINQGAYPNETVISDKLSAFAKQATAAGKSFIYWGQWENNKINTAAIAAVAAAGPAVPGTPAVPIADGWIYFKGDYFYANKKWYYMKILDGQLCVQMATGGWKKFG